MSRINAKKIGARMAWCRNFAKLTMTDVSNITGIGKGTINYYEHGQRMPGSINCIKLADLYGVTLDFMLCRVNYCKIRGFGNVTLEEDNSLS